MPAANDDTAVTLEAPIRDWRARTIVVRFVDAVEHGKRSKEVNSVECASIDDCAMPVLEAVVRERGDGNRLTYRGHVRHDSDENAREDEPCCIFFVSCVNEPDCEVREHVVEHEVRVRHEVEANGNVVEHVRVKSVLSLEHAVEVVRVPVVSNEAEYCDPQVGLRDVALVPSSAAVANVQELC
eukprot:CAMPEP_0206123720 /NCGR_PEP_ID=MMETSP1472-20131121/5646_1 /ASSEMBLY_ACC=CAM_ASM_001108 /TAXON_ID=41880 /ORGANISM="Pycnococcus provasolii, Strain RCC251" /LENGTH=182 /DNA_ID=CAMNT_0053514367 /DNA_START=77 /DNA_END=624 /DNA_ORIENTATION=+